MNIMGFLWGVGFYATIAIGILLFVLSIKKLPEFLKPNVKKLVLLFFIVYGPGILLIIYSLNPSLSILGWLGSIGGDILLFPFFSSACSLGFFDCGPGKSSTFLIIIPLFILSAEIFLFYVFTCLIVSGWNRIFSHFGEKNKHYEKIAVVALSVAFIFILIALPIIGTHFINVKSVTSPNMRSANTTSDGGIIVQELIIQNHFIFPVTYQLPEVTACLYVGSKSDADTIGGITVSLHYVTEKEQFVNGPITINALSETRYYLVAFVGGRDNFLEKYNKNSDLLLLKTSGMNQWVGYCPKDEDIHSLDKIEISE